MNLTKIALGIGLPIGGVAAAAAIAASVPAGATPASHSPASYSPASRSAVPSSVPASPVVVRSAGPQGSRPLGRPGGRATAVVTPGVVPTPYPSCLSAGASVDLPPGATGPATCAPTSGR